MGLTVPRKGQDSEAVTRKEMTPGLGLVSMSLVSYLDPFDRADKTRGLRETLAVFKRDLIQRTPRQYVQSLPLAVPLTRDRKDPREWPSQIHRPG